MRLADVESLLANDRHSAAYYLSGYVIECGLKACIAKKTKRYDFPDKTTTLNSYTHELKKLIQAAGLEAMLVRDCTDDPQFAVNWTLVSEWSENQRYDATHTKQRAEEMYQAIADQAHGVLQWIKRYW